jgi:hypothetical protein
MQCSLLLPLGKSTHGLERFAAAYPVFSIQAGLESYLIRAIF